MKKLSIAAVFAITIISSAFAGNNGIPRFKVAESFINTFPHATEIVYAVKGNFTEVNFSWNNLKLQAFYDLEGNWIGTSRQIAIKDLPVSSLLEINKKFPGSVPTEAIEFDHADNGMSYYVTIAGSEKSYVLQILTDGTISVFKKMKN
jgi:hypothetical protein